SQYRLFQLTIAADDVLFLSQTNLPANWQQQPASIDTARIGDNWLTQQASLALSVPSVIAPREYNILLNPLHPRFDACLATATELEFMPDPRLTL
ncbi:MAG TPA: RES family NAD+ phosphorylase, partial [Rheinheimera sp.]|uniref:RES family NAD+ phosphorylase n=1 Tax=Rheinheimera sp. TaxID=1869214 RepID=UPI002F94ACF2